MTGWSQTSVYTNVGGPLYVDGSGQTWTADSGCSSSGTFTRALTISGTADSTLYQTGRSDNSSIGCAYTVTNYNYYNVTLRFAETDPNVSRSGQRIFNIFINGVLRYPALDIMAISRVKNAAVDITIPFIPVSQSQISIVLAQITGQPILQAISIIASTNGSTGGSGIGFYVSGFTGSTTNYSGTTSTSLISYSIGQQFIWKPDVTNSSTAPCLNVNILGCKPIIHKSDSSTLAVGELDTTQYCFSLYDGTSMLTEDCFTGPGRIRYTCGAAPGTPTSGSGTTYCDSTSKNLSIKDDAGIVKHGVQTQAVVPGNCLTGIADDGISSITPCSAASTTWTTAGIGYLGPDSLSGNTEALVANTLYCKLEPDYKTITLNHLSSYAVTGTGGKGVLLAAISSAGANLGSGTINTGPNLLTVTTSSSIVITAASNSWHALCIATEATDLRILSPYPSSTLAFGMLNPGTDKRWFTCANPITGTGTGVTFPTSGCGPMSTITTNNYAPGINGVP